MIFLSFHPKRKLCGQREGVVREGETLICSRNFYSKRINYEVDLSKVIVSYSISY